MIWAPGYKVPKTATALGSHFVSKRKNIFLYSSGTEIYGIGLRGDRLQCLKISPQQLAPSTNGYFYNYNILENFFFQRGKTCCETFLEMKKFNSIALLLKAISIVIVICFLEAAW